MRWLSFLFSFGGRVNRAKYWLFWAIAITLTTAFATLVYMYLAPGDILTIQDTNVVAYHGIPFAYIDGITIAAAVAIAAVEFALLVAALALTVKRLHDRNKGTVWLPVFLVLPLVSSLAALCLNFAGSNWTLLAPQAGNIADCANRSIDGWAARILPWHLLPAGISVAGWVLALIALFFSLWAFVELYVLPGAKGDNRFGPDPLG